MNETLRRWKKLEAQLNGRVAFGDAGVRDPENPCESFEPVATKDCAGDGHYMCRECARLRACQSGGHKHNNCGWRS